MHSEPQLSRLAAFPIGDRGGNPAGVWLGQELPDAASMQALARELGYSETAFLAPLEGPQRQIRYFSPEAEVPFCGHATIAAGVALGQRSGPGDYFLHTRAGEVELQVSRSAAGIEARLRSVPPQQQPVHPALLAEVLGLLGWRSDELDPALPPVRAFAGAWHLVLAAASRQRLAQLDYPFEAMKALMLREGLTTLQLVWRENAERYHARDPFPVGGVVEDPATGAAAAALGGYLRDAGLLKAPAQFSILQGEDMGQACLLQVEVPASGGIYVRGGARPL